MLTGVGVLGCTSNVLLLGLLKAGSLDGNRVRAGFEERPAVRSRLIRVQRIAQPGCVFDNGDLCVGNCRALCVGDGSGDGSEISLPEGGAAKKQRVKEKRTGA